MFHHDGQWIISLIILGAIALKTVAKGGDWFDFLQGTSKYSNARTNFEFNLLFVMVGVLIFGGIFCLLISSLGSGNNVSVQSPQPKAVAIAQGKVVHAAHKMHSAHSHK